MLRRGYSVDVGVVDVRRPNENSFAVRRQLDVDFVANMGSRRFYIQSALELGSQEKMAQEKGSLVNIDDSFKKIIIRRSPVEPWYDDDGILHLGLMDFLLAPESIYW